MTAGWILLLALLPGGAGLLHLFHRRLRVSLAAPREPVERSLTEHEIEGETVRIPTRRDRTLVGCWLPLAVTASRP
jgi:hypothetical protein